MRTCSLKGLYFPYGGIWQKLAKPNAWHFSCHNSEKEKKNSWKWFGGKIGKISASVTWFHVKFEQSMWIFQDFFCYSYFTWNQFLSFWSPKNCHFNYISSSEFWIFGYFRHFQVADDQKIKIQSLQNGSNDIFYPSEISQNWFHVKSKWLEKC